MTRLVPQVLFFGSLLLLASAATAQEPPSECPPLPALFPLVPPTAPQRLQIVTERPVRSGEMRRFGLEYRLQFHAVGRGHGLTVTLLAIDKPEAMHAGDEVAAIFAPIVGRPLEFVYDAAANKPMLRQSEAEALWLHFTSESAARAQAGKPGEARDLVAMMLELPAEQREQLLFADLGHMLRFMGQPLGADVTARRGGPSGDCRLVQLAAQQGPIDGGAGRYAEVTWLVEVESGLVREQHEQVSLRPSADELLHLASRTTRRLVPE